MSHRARIAVVEDHIFQRTYTRKLIVAQPDLDVVFEGETLSDLINWLRYSRPHQLPDLVLLDLMAERQPHADPELVKKLVSDGIRVLVLSAMASPPLVRRVIKAGVHGVVGKRDSEHDLFAAIRTVLSNGEWMSPELASIIRNDPRRPTLSDQEERALVLYASGVPIKTVARSIGVKDGTVKKYLQRVRAKYAEAGRPMTSRLEMSKIASEDGYTSFFDL